MDTNNAMCAMALNSYAGSMGATTWVIDKYPTVKIKISSSQGDSVPMPRKYSIWGLNECIGHMTLSVPRFDTIKCSLKWGRGAVGQIETSKNDVAPESSTALAVAVTPTPTSPIPTSTGWHRI